ncbi:DNA topoisomerase [Enterococcus raffinosus]|uniref:DNA topoisomerase n=1 Tax=Enterococcus raffinosus TaxID=71452 RepID=UPI0028907D93|nr:DNA topoisomerase [Enterococcus raffinosus]MDT2525105.1 DNA topoisomerase [Enterococcus raffinosus]MDT2592460.1 DNA topoisomerase [Enterococcus raffinosus]
MYAVLAEKPSQAMDYAKVLSNGHFKREQGAFHIEKSPILNNEEVYVTHAVGHLVGLSSPDYYDEKYKRWSMENLPIMPDEFHYEVLKKTKAQFTLVKKYLKKADKIVIASDSAREGEAIGMKIVLLAGVSKKPILRMWANSTTPKELTKAFKNIFDEKKTWPLFQEAKAREEIDWLIGMNFTRFYSIKYQKETGNKEMFNVGRVQTPTLMKVVEREDEIKNFVPTKYYPIVGKFVDNDQISLNKDGENKFNTKQEAVEYLSNNNIVVGKSTSFLIKNVIDEVKTEKPKKLYDLGAIQDVANKKWKYSLEDTLNGIQRLYERFKVVSYPRTESQYVGEGEFDQLKTHFDEYCNILGISETIEHGEPRKEFVNQSKVTDHYALIPTEKIPSKEEIKDMSEIERNIYYEILNHTISIFLKDYKFNKKTIELEKGDLVLKTTVSVTIEEGFKKYKKSKNNNDEDNQRKLDFLKYLEKDQLVDLEILIDEKETKVPKRYTQATLGGRDSLMSKYKLGTPATKTGIVQNLVKNGYLKEEKNYLYPKEKAYKLREILADSMVGQVELTSYMEDSLHDIGASVSDDKYILDMIKKMIVDTVGKEA